MKLLTSSIHTVSNEDWRISWLGFAFHKNRGEGEELANSLLKSLATDNIVTLQSNIKGNFVICVEDLTRSEWWAFTDRSGMHPLFYTDECMSDSLSALILNTDGLKPNVPAIYEFLSHAYYDPEFLPVEGIRRLLGSQLLHGRKNEIPKITPRRPADPISNSDSAFVNSMSDLSIAIKGKLVSSDLTAGLDSRLNAACLSHSHTNLELSIASVEEHPDVVIPTELASRLQIPFHVTSPRNPEEVNEETISELLALGDGLLPDLELIDRKSRLFADRVKRGVAVSIDGNGGEIYRDHWLLQDFPFYKTRRVNIDRLLSARLRSLTPEQLGLTGKSLNDATDALREHRQRLIDSSLETNLQTYDQIVLRRISGSSGPLSVSLGRRNGLTTYSALIEHELTIFASKLPLRDRILDRFHRRIISRLIPDANDVPTNWGIRPDDSIPVALFRYGRALSRRSLSKLSHLATGKRLIVMPSPGSKQPYHNAILNSPHWNTAKTVLASHGIISSTETLNVSSYPAVSRLFAAAYVLSLLDNQPIVETLPMQSHDLI